MYNKTTDDYRLRQVQNYQAKLLPYWQEKGLNEKCIGILTCLLYGNQDLRDAYGRYPKKNCNQIRIRHRFRSKQELLDLLDQSGVFVITDDYIIPNLPSFEELGVEPEVVADCTETSIPVLQNATKELQNATDWDVNINMKSTTISNNSDSIDIIESSSSYPSFSSSESEAKRFFHSLDASRYPDKAVADALYGFVEDRFEGIGRETARRYVKLLVGSLEGYLDSQPKFLTQTHKDRCQWITNIIRSKNGIERLENVLKTHQEIYHEQQEQDRKSKRLREVEERRRQMHENHPYSQYEYSTSDGQRRYDLDGDTYTIPIKAPARPSEDSFWNHVENIWTIVSA